MFRTSQRVHIYGIHCYNPNAGLVRQKAGMEALIVFIGSPVTGDPVLDIAWQRQNHEKRRPFKLKKHIKTGSMKGFSWCLHSNTSEIQPIFGRKQMSYISSKFPFTGCTKMVKYDSAWHPAENQWSKTTLEYLVVMVIYPIERSKPGIIVSQVWWFFPWTFRTRSITRAQQLVRWQVCSGGRIPANPKVLVERAWRSLQNKNRRHWPNAKKTSA